MADEELIPLLSKPGIKRDGTLFDGDFYTDGAWVRFVGGKPRKIRGFRQLSKSVTGYGRGLDAHPDTGFLYVHVGSQTKLEQVRLTLGSLVPSAFTDRTPGGFATSDNNLWQFAQIYDATSSFTAGTTYLIAHAAPNALNIESDDAASVYYGDITDTAALTAIPSSSVSGGVLALYPYLMIFGSDGYINTSVANQPANLTATGSLQARVTSKKIVRGLQLRGGAANSPAGLLWSLDSLLRVYWVGGTPIFSFDTISAEVSILGSNTPIEYNGTYYWIGTDRFFRFNGVIQDLPNNLNSDYFFDNLNWACRNKTFAFKVPRFGEIWWCYCHGSATEPNHAIIYNVGLQTWYDTALPPAGRTCAANAAGLPWPLATCATQTAGKTSLWQHEIGTDSVTTAGSSAIQSYFDTGVLSLGRPGTQAPSQSLSLSVIEPDFVQSGTLHVTIKGKMNARAAEVESDAQEVTETATTKDQQLVTFKGKNTYRQLRVRFESNEVGGDYETGLPQGHVRPSQGTLLGGVQE